MKMVSATVKFTSTLTAICFSLAGAWAQDQGVCSNGNEKARHYYQNGNHFFYEKNYGQAIGDYTQAIAADPNFGQAYGNRAAARFNYGDIRGAQEDLAMASKHSSDKKSLLSLKYVIDERVRMTPQAWQLLNQHAGRNPGHFSTSIPNGYAALPFAETWKPTVNFIRSSQYPGTEDSPPGDPFIVKSKRHHFEEAPEKTKEDGGKFTSRDYFREGTEKAKAGDNDEAIALFTRSINMEQGFGDAYESRGMALYHSGDYAAALPDLEAADRITAGKQQLKEYIKILKKRLYRPYY
jgi:tetratricopeptide (TPR) repeat protein